MIKHPSWTDGREVLDAREVVSINIRQHHIDDAVSGDGEKCVAARCVLQSLGASHCYFYRSVCYVEWDNDQPILRYQVSAKLFNNVISILDDPKKSNKLIKPGVYNLNPPAPLQRLGLNRMPKPGAKKRDVSPTGKRRVLARIAAAQGK